MKREIRLLIVDDHPMTVKGYQLVLQNTLFPFSLSIDSAFDSDEVLLKLKQSQRGYDLVLLDISLPASTCLTITSGEDFGSHFRKVNPEVKVIVHTSLNDQQRILDIFNTLRPEGFLIKNDIDAEVLVQSINMVMDGHPFYSERTERLLGTRSKDSSQLDVFDRKILYHLSLGEKMKNLPKHIPLSMPTLERRKKKLRIFFGIGQGDDFQLLKAARKKDISRSHETARYTFRNGCYFPKTDIFPF